MSTSRHLHPTYGGRFLAKRISEEPLTYEVEVFLPEHRVERCSLRWSDEGQAIVEPALQHPWAQEEVIKLARVLRRTKQDRLSRWRG